MSHYAPSEEYAYRDIALAKTSHYIYDNVLYHILKISYLAGMNQLAILSRLTVCRRSLRLPMNVRTMPFLNFSRRKSGIRILGGLMRGLRQIFWLGRNMKPTSRP